jgi:hypothetical protein
MLPSRDHASCLQKKTEDQKTSAFNAKTVPADFDPPSTWEACIRGLGLRIHRESSVPRGLSFSNQTARLMVETRKEINTISPETLVKRQGDGSGTAIMEPPLGQKRGLCTMSHQSSLVSDGRLYPYPRSDRRWSFRRVEFDVQESFVRR